MTSPQADQCRVTGPEFPAFQKKSWPRSLRSQEWFGGAGKNAIMHRSWMKNQGVPADAFDGRPVIGICNTWSELTPCNARLRELVGRRGSHVDRDSH